MALKTIEVWVMVDEDGDYEASTDAESVAVRYGENIGHDDERGTRMVKLTLTIPLPERIEITAVVPDTEGVPTVSVG